MKTRPRQNIPLHPAHRDDAPLRDRWLAILHRNFAIGVDTSRRMRQQRRFDVEKSVAEVLLEHMAATEAAVPLTMTVLDVSPGGVMLRSFEPLERGTGLALKFAINYDEITLMGRVMHCTSTLGGFKVGIRLVF